MGLKQAPATSDYWSSGILGSPDIIRGWPKTKFWAMLHSLHLNNNAETLPRDHTDHDKLHKIRPVLDRLNLNFEKHWIKMYQLIGYKGRSSLKQYLPMKPTKEDIKYSAFVTLRLVICPSFQYIQAKINNQRVVLVLV